MFDWVAGGLGGLLNLVGGAAADALGWTWSTIVNGLYLWLANGLVVLIEWVWSVLDSGTTPRITERWFANGLAVQVGLLALAVTVALMLASAVQAALAGRPEQIIDAVKHGIWSIVASAVTITVIDLLLGIVDEASAAIWQSGRGELVTLIERIVAVATMAGPLAATVVGPLCLVVGFVGLIGLVVSLMMRSTLIYLAAALAPLVWSANVLPLFRGSARKLIHLTVALIGAKLAIVITLVVAVHLIARPGSDTDHAAVVNDAATAAGTLMAGFVSFLIGAVSPLVLYKLMPTVEGAMVSAGVAGGWGRSATTAAHTALMVKSLGAAAGVSAATRPVAGQGGVAGTGGGTAGRRGSIAGLTGSASGASPRPGPPESRTPSEAPEGAAPKAPGTATESVPDSRARPASPLPSGPGASPRPAHREQGRARPAATDTGSVAGGDHDDAGGDPGA